MQLTRLTDYGLRVLMYAALRPANRKCRIVDVAESFGIPRNNVMKIVNKLANEGFINTTRGKGGGFQLGKPETEIYVGEVVSCLEGNLQIIDCESYGGCPIVPSCRLRRAFGSAREAFLQELDCYTLKDLVAPTAPLRRLLRIAGQ